LAHTLRWLRKERAKGEPDVGVVEFLEGQLRGKLRERHPLNMTYNI
jgi:hypothetical protein